MQPWLSTIAKFEFTSLMIPHLSRRKADRAVACPARFPLDLFLAWVSSPLVTHIHIDGEARSSRGEPPSDSVKVNSRHIERIYD